MMHLSKETILGAEDLPTEEVGVPEWGGSVLVRGLTGTDRDDYELSMIVHVGGQTAPDVRNARAKLVARCVVGDDGQRLFTDEDAAALGKKSAVALRRVFDVAARLSALDEGSVGEAVENFGGAPGSGSSLASPNGSESLSKVS